MAFWQELFCVTGRLHKVLSVNAPITQVNCLGIDFPITRTSVTRKNCFRIICVIISGLMVEAIWDCDSPGALRFQITKVAIFLDLGI